jgi:hypothetical protein
MIAKYKFPVRKKLRLIDQKFETIGRMTTDDIML